MMHGTTPTGRDYADIAYYTYNLAAFPDIIRKIYRLERRPDYACKTSSAP